MPDEVTIAEILKARDDTGRNVRQVALGDKKPHLPNDKGFDYFYGHYSNDMVPTTWRNRNSVDPL